MAPVPLKAKAEPGATAPPVCHCCTQFCHSRSGSGVLSFWLSLVAQPAQQCSGTRQQLHLPEWRQGLHPAVLLLCLTVHLGRCWEEAGKAHVAKVLGRQNRNRRRARNKGLLRQRNSVYCLGREDTSTDWSANVIQPSPGLAMQLKAGQWWEGKKKEDDEERRKCPKECDQRIIIKKIDTVLQSARYLVFKRLSIISGSKVTCSSYCNELEKSIKGIKERVNSIIKMMWPIILFTWINKSWWKTKP